jgi:hypothetical protein
MLFQEKDEHNHERAHAQGEIERDYQVSQTFMDADAFDVMDALPNRFQIRMGKLTLHTKTSSLKQTSASKFTSTMTMLRRQCRSYIGRSRRVYVIR